jgi:hypothetical protein
MCPLDEMRKKRKPSVSSQILGRKGILMYPIVDPTSGCVPFFIVLLITF